jgi:hypothetical protein
MRHFSMPLPGLIHHPKIVGRYLIPAVLPGLLAISRRGAACRRSWASQATPLHVPAMGSLLDRFAFPFLILSYVIVLCTIASRYYSF